MLRKRNARLLFRPPSSGLSCGHFPCQVRVLRLLLLAFLQRLDTISQSAENALFAKRAAVSSVHTAVASVRLLGSRRATIGRGPDNSVVLDLDSVSRRHCTLRPQR